MGSKGRIPPPHLRRPFPGPGIVHPDPFGPALRPAPPPPGAFPAFDILPPAEVLEQKLAGQQVEMQGLAAENQRLAATHGTLRQELAAAQHELQMLHVHIGAINSEREQQMRGLVDNVAKMETDLKDTEKVRLELQQAWGEAENLVVARDELVSKVHQLNQDLQRAHADVQQIPALITKLESLRQEYQQCRISYDYEKKLFHDHLESLQVMEKNYVAMSRELEKLRLELSKTANVDMMAVPGGPHGGAAVKNESEASGPGRPVGQNMYEEGYSVPQGQGHAALPAANSSAGAANVGVAANAVAGAGAGTGTPAYVGAQSGSAPSKPGFDASRGPGYEVQKGLGYDTSRGQGSDPSRGPSYDIQWGRGYESQRGPIYDAQRGHGYDPQRVPGYDAQRLPSYDVQRGLGYDVQRGLGYDMQRLPNYDPSMGASYDAASRGAAGLHGQMAQANNVPYGSATPPTRVGSGYEAPARGGNPVRR